MQDTKPLFEVVSSRYEIVAEIGHGGMGVVYRTLDRLSGQMVALKKVNALYDQLEDTRDSVDFRIALAQEFKTLASLRHPNIISVLDYGFDRSRQPYFTMELLETAPTILRAAEKVTLAQKIQLVLQMLQALAYLHRRGIIHRDLKPDNVLVADGTVKVLDFGLATTKQQRQNTGVAVGTLTYMAPELWSGESATEASDIYAAGIIIYELLGKPLVFSAKDVNALLSQITQFVPDLDSLEGSPALKKVLAGMLARAPEQRYRDSHELINLISEAFGLPNPVETSPIRESYLQAANFIGREREITAILDALISAQMGEGSTWLIAGESGVGKSRLLDEVQTHALVDGALVLRGQAIAEGGAPYQMWRSVLRRLALQTDLSDLELSVLSALVPDIGKLFGREVSEAPEIEAEASANRLLYTIENVFRRQTTTLVLLLEDLHWANEDLTILKRLNEMVKELPLLILATYRDDERVNLPGELPGAQSIKLARLSKTTITELTVSMLGEVGHDANVVNLLERETEGNILFIIEALRSLAEEAGRLDDIARITLPAHIFAGGIQATLRRRLDHVPPDARPLLNVAAVAGRQLDLPVLQAVAPAVSIPQWLQAVASVIEVQDDSYRFAHDKLRERLLEDLSVGKQVEAHGQIGKALEIVYNDDASQVPILAYHYGYAAENGQPTPEEFVKAVQYVEKAASQFLSQNAYEKATQMCRQLFALEERRVVLFSTPPALQQTASPNDRRANWYKILGDSQFRLGHFEEGYENLKRSARLYGYPMPEKPAGFMLGIANQVLIQIRHRFLPFTFFGRISEQKRAQLLAITQTYRSAGVLNYAMNKQMPSLYTTLTALNISERAGLSEDLANSYGVMTMLTGLLHLNSAAEWYYDQAMSMARQQNAASALAEIQIVTGLYHVLVGDDDKARPDLTEALALCDRIGNIAGWGYCQLALSALAYNHGDFGAAYGLLEAVIERSRSTHFVPTHILALQFQSIIDLYRNNLEVALNKLTSGLQLLEEVHNDPLTQIAFKALLAQAHLYNGSKEQALEALDAVLDPVVQSNPNPTHAALVYAAIVETGLMLLENTAEPVSHQRHQRMLQQLSKVTQSFQRMSVPTGKSTALRCRAGMDWQVGRHEKAIANWQQSIDVATKFNAPYDIGRAHYEWGRHLPETDPARRDHLQTANALFEKIGAQFALNQTQAALAATQQPEGAQGDLTTTARGT